MNALFDVSTTTPDVPVRFLDQSLLNEYGEECVPVVIRRRPEGDVLRYRCLADKCSAAFEAWLVALQDDRNAPQPMPAGHCMFVNPEDYDSVAWSS